MMRVRVSNTDHTVGDVHVHGREKKRPINLTYSDKARENAAKSRKKYLAGSKHTKKVVDLSAVPPQYTGYLTKLFCRGD